MTIHTGADRRLVSDKLFFFHNPKAGGLSLRTVLADMYAPERIFHEDPEDPYLYKAKSVGYRSMAGFDLYMGHFGYDVFRAVNRGHAAITNFRHPVTRLTSLYNYFRYSVQRTPEELAAPEYAAVRMAKSSTFEAFVLCDDPQVTIRTCDHHFRQLSDSPASMAFSRSEREVEAMIKDMPWFYVCEFPDMSYLWARHALGWNLDHIVRDNVTPLGDGAASVLDITEALNRKIMARNERDLAIYRMAVDRLIAETSSRKSGANAFIAKPIQALRRVSRQLVGA